MFGYLEKKLLKGKEWVPTFCTWPSHMGHVDHAYGSSVSCDMLSLAEGLVLLAVS
jgi:hypothetical protein